MICIGDSLCNYGLPNKANWLQRLERPGPAGAVREPHIIPYSCFHPRSLQTKHGPSGPEVAAVEKCWPGKGRRSPCPSIAAPASSKRHCWKASRAEPGQTSARGVIINPLEKSEQLLAMKSGGYSKFRPCFN